jgi:thioesterase domain-containing protein/acyl carrier protein
MPTDENRAATIDPAPIGFLGQPVYSFPTTVAQKGFWYLDQLERGNPSWNIAVRFRIRGPLNIPTLERAINEVVRRHEILRTTFSRVDGDPVQVVHLSAEIPLRFCDLSSMTESAREIEEEHRTVDEGRLRFDLETGPLIRAGLLRLGQDDHMLLVTVHHIVSDGWSIGVFSEELAKIYDALENGNPHPLPDLPLQFADYAVWENKRNRSDQDQRRFYWKTKLADLPTLEIPPDYARPRIRTNHGYILSTLLSVDLTQALTDFAHRCGCSLFAISLAALKVLVHHHSQRNDVYVGTLLAGRDRVELEPLIGLFINTIVLRTDLSGDPTFAELVGRVRQTVEEGIAQAIEFPQLVEAVQPKRDRSRPPLYGINFIYQRDFVKPAEFAGLTLTPVPSKSPGAIYDLNFFMVQRSDGWRLSCEYNSDLYESATINRLIAQMQHLLEQVRSDPNRRISEFSFPENLSERAPGSAFPGRNGTAKNLTLEQAGLSSGSAPAGTARRHHGREYVPPRNEIEAKLVEIWTSVLGQEVDVLDSFFDLGGHSLLAARLLKKIGDVLGVELPAASLLEAFTVEGQAQLVCEYRKQPDPGATAERTTAKIPLFYLGGYPMFRPLIERLSAGREFHSLGMQESIVRELNDPHSLPRIAEHFVRIVRERNPHGPYVLAGWCSHGLLALEMAQQLRAQGEPVALVVMIEASNPLARLAYPKWRRWIGRTQLKFRLLQFEYAYLREVPRVDAREYILARVTRKIASLSGPLRRMIRSRNSGRKTPIEVLYDAADAYRPQPYPWPVLLIRSRRKSFGFAQKLRLGWGDMLESLTVAEVKGDHFSIMGKHAGGLAEEISRHMENCDRVFRSAPAAHGR